MTTPRKKLIEVALPLEAINKASAREKSIRHGHPSTLHLWWARRPLAAARAVIFAQMVDDPSTYVDTLRSDPKLLRKAESTLKSRRKLWEQARETFEKAEAAGIAAPNPGHEPTLEEILAEQERDRLFKIIEDLVLWENTTNEAVLQRARDEIWQSWRRACAENADHPHAKDLFDRHKLPAFHDPFAGGGALPLEAQRLGLESYASDLNPVAVLINKAMIEIPPKFAGRPPVNPESRRQEVGNSDALSRTDRLAEGNRGNEGSVPARSASSEGGDLRDAVTDHAGRGFSPSEHRRGVEPRIGEGESPVSGDSARLPGGDRNISHPLRGDRLVPENRDSMPARVTDRSGQNAHDTAAQLPPDIVENRNEGLGNSRRQAGKKSLTPNSYLLFPDRWKGAQGLAEDVRYYGRWMRDEAERRIGHLYPKIEITKEMTKDRPDLKSYVGQQLTVIAWLWARTVKSPNPAFKHVDVPLASTFMLSTKPGKEAYVEPVIEGDSYRFTVKVGKPKDAEGAKNGTKLARGANFRCVMSGSPIAQDHIRGEFRAKQAGERLMAIVAEGERGRLYLSPTEEYEAIARQARPEWRPEVEMNQDSKDLLSGRGYGFKYWHELFTPRQLVALTTFSDLVQEAREQVKRDVLAAGLPDDGRSLDEGGIGAAAYADAVVVYLAFAVDNTVDRN